MQSCYRLVTCILILRELKIVQSKPDVGVTKVIDDEHSPEHGVSIEVQPCEWMTHESDDHHQRTGSGSQPQTLLPA